MSGRIAELFYLKSNLYDNSCCSETFLNPDCFLLLPAVLLDEEFFGLCVISIIDLEK